MLSVSGPDSSGVNSDTHTVVGGITFKIYKCLTYDFFLKAKSYDSWKQDI